MYGRWEGELWFHRRHMWPVLSPSTQSLVAPINSSVFIDFNSFTKDGRKIHVGDCALFEPAHESPPFVGLIRRLIVGKEDILSLSVNWLYRPADVKLLKGASLEAAPNEIFYSFHQDEIPAASLLHPCKVAFLRKGVELPSRISSFVCRRVYDIETKRLWWLTDQNYIKERQEEVDQLLDKTRVEMHGALQAGGHSPKPLNGPNGTTQLKSSTDSIQNSTSIPSQVKSKKREHGVHSSDLVKHERLSKSDDADSVQLIRPENMLKTEIAKLTDKGGLVDFDGVEKLIQLMRHERAEKKVDLACRFMLVDVISVTDRFDCLNRFVQRRGLHVLDEWLQEIHKGKIGNGSPKGTDKSIEEFLFALLRALDKLPVNLLALQTCNVGKSVNHLRSHKNIEIQKKARSLVDTWKKRVEAEMNVIETRSGTRRGGSWPNKLMISTSQASASRTQQGKPNSGEVIARSPESPGSTKIAPPSDMPLVTIKEEKSRSSSPCINNSQSCSSEHGKTGSSCREDAPSPTSGSLNKICCGISHARKSSNVVKGSTVSGGQKVELFDKFSSVDRSFASGKGSPIRATPERVADVSSVDNTNDQRLIVRLPNTGRSLAHTASGGSFEDGPTTSGRSPLVLDGPQGNDVVAVDTDSCQGKEGPVGSDEVKMETAGDGETVEKLTEASKATGLASDVTLKAGKSYEASYSLVNALVESCAKISEAYVCAPPGDDDVGMNLLASVAAGEMSRADLSPVGSSENKPPVPEDTCSGNDANVRQSIEDGCQSEDNLKTDNRSPSKEDKNASEKALGNADATGAYVKVETQVNGESASWSSSDEHEDEKKLVRKQSSSSNLVLKKEAGKDSELQSMSCGLGPKMEEADDKTEQSERPHRDSDSSVKENIDKNEVPSSEKSQAEVQDDKHTDVTEGGSSEATAVRLDFDLNEVLPSDDGIQGEVERRFSAAHTPYQLPSTSSLFTGNQPASITVAAAAKGPFYPLENLIRGKTEIGWRGSAATSAFRPAEPRKVIVVPDHHSSKHVRPLLDFDLNVGVMEDVTQNNASSRGGLSLDLNACEDCPDVGQPSVSFGRQLPPRSSLLSGGGFSNSEVNPSMGFDLNSGPGVEQNGCESLPLPCNGMQFLSAVPSVRMKNINNMEMGNLSSWFPQNSTYPPVVHGAAASQRMLTPDILRGPVLSSSPAVAFPSTMPFQYHGFPFETNFPVSSNTVSTSYAGGSSGGPLCFPAMPSQLMGPSSVVSSAYRPPPFMMSMANNIGPDGRRWGSQGGGGLDLNAGPGGKDLERRDETLRRMLPLAGPQGMTDEQIRMFQQMAAAGGGGGALKRKEPDDGRDADRISYKHRHPSWQ